MLLENSTWPCKFLWCQPAARLLIFLYGGSPYTALLKVGTMLINSWTLEYFSPLKEALSCWVSVISCRMDWSLCKPQLPEHLGLPSAISLSSILSRNKCLVKNLLLWPLLVGRKVWTCARVFEHSSIHSMCLPGGVLQQTRQGVTLIHLACTHLSLTWPAHNCHSPGLHTSVPARNQCYWPPGERVRVDGFG